MKQLSSLKCLIKNYKINGFQIYIYKPSQKLTENSFMTATNMQILRNKHNKNVQKVYGGNHKMLVRSIINQSINK